MIDKDKVSAGQQQLGFCEMARKLRSHLKTVANDVKSIQWHPDCDITVDLGDTSRDRGEMKANVILAFRHIEDATMRLGKAIQAYDGGVSVYDK